MALNTETETGFTFKVQARVLCAFEGPRLDWTPTTEFTLPVACTVREFCVMVFKSIYDMENYDGLFEFDVQVPERDLWFRQREKDVVLMDAGVREGDLFEMRPTKRMIDVRLHDIAGSTIGTISVSHEARQEALEDRVRSDFAEGV